MHLKRKQRNYLGVLSLNVLVVIFMALWLNLKNAEGNNMADKDTINGVATLIYGAALPETPEEAMIRIGSTPYSRAENYKLDPNFKPTVLENLYSSGAYYEFAGGNTKVEALKKGDIQDPELWKRSLQIAYGLEVGTIEKTGDQFFHTPGEQARQKKSKSFDYNLVETNKSIKSGNKVKDEDSWDFMSYKKPKEKGKKNKVIDYKDKYRSFPEAFAVARKEGKKEFIWDGRPIAVKLK